MKKEENMSTAAAVAPIKEPALMSSPQSEAGKSGLSPIFVEAEKMFERFAELTKETAHKAYDFFQKRGGEFGMDLEDWFKAESEILLRVPVEITQTDEQINVSAAVPGFKPEEIEVSVKENILILSGKTEQKEKREDENTFYSEWRSNRFFRQLTLPAEVDAGKAEANLKDGVLHLSMPKLPVREATRISVNAE